MSRAWAMFWLVGLIWGSSFLLIRVGVEEVSPSQLVFIRCLIAAIGLNVVLFLRGKRLPKDWSSWRAMIIVGLFNSSVPYLLLALGEQTVTSSVTSALQSTTALFGMVLAHFAFTDERITWQRAVGISLGFVGGLVLAARPTAEGVQDSSFIGALCILGASFSYAATTVFSRKATRGKMEPMVIAASSFIIAAISAFGFMMLEPLLGGRAAVPLADLPQDVLRAVLTLGFVNTFVAYLFFYYIIQELGASRSTMVTYVVPVVGLLLGGLVLKEPIDRQLLFGASLIFTGIAIANIGWRGIIQRMRLRTATS